MANAALDRAPQSAEGLAEPLRVVPALRVVAARYTTLAPAILADDPGSELSANVLARGSRSGIKLAQVQFESQSGMTIATRFDTSTTWIRALEPESSPSSTRCMLLMPGP